jgi:phosphoribosyl-ATP pyrophosphohydrolase/phosphoribosyl-AMP cyclohydrolase
VEKPFETGPGLSGWCYDRLATFYSRSRKGRWCKGETSGNFIRVEGMYLDCDRDSVVYLGEPDGPSCHTVTPPPPCPSTPTIISSQPFTT